MTDRALLVLLREHFCPAWKDVLDETAKLLGCGVWNLVPTVQSLMRERDEALWAAQEAKERYERSTGSDRVPSAEAAQAPGEACGAVGRGAVEA